jgi:hypothetical protein
VCEVHVNSEVLEAAGLVELGPCRLHEGIYFPIQSCVGVGTLELPAGWKLVKPNDMLRGTDG